MENSILDNEDLRFSNTVAEKFLKTRYKGPNCGVSVSSALRASVTMRGEIEEGRGGGWEESKHGANGRECIYRPSPQIAG